MTAKPTTIRLTETDREAIRCIKERYGLSSDASAIRLALRILAQAERLDVVMNESSSEEVT